MGQRWVPIGDVPSPEDYGRALKATYGSWCAAFPPRSRCRRTKPPRPAPRAQAVDPGSLGVEAESVAPKLAGQSQFLHGGQPFAPNMLSYKHMLRACASQTGSCFLRITPPDIAQDFAQGHGEVLPEAMASILKLGTSSCERGRPAAHTGLERVSDDVGFDYVDAKEEGAWRPLGKGSLTYRQLWPNGTGVA